MGSGAYGKVEKLCLKSNCTSCVAIKTFYEKENLPDQTFSDFTYEKYLTNKVNGALKGTQFHNFITKPVNLKNYTNELVTEFYDNNVFSTLKKHKQTLSVNDLQAFFIEVFGTLDYLWTNHKILHMDLKIDNLIVTFKTTEKVPREIKFKDFLVEIPSTKIIVKIIDWGLSVDLLSKKYVDLIFNKEEKDFQGQCYLPFFDLTHFLYDCRELYNVCDSNGKQFLNDLILWIYGSKTNYVSFKKKQVRECIKAKEQIKKGTLKLKEFRDIFLAKRPDNSNMFTIKKKIN